MTLSRLLALLLCLLLACPRGWGGVVINEIVTNASDRVLRWTSTGVPKLGTGVSWYETAYNDTLWQTGNSPFGFGTFATAPTTAIATNLQTQMYYLTPSAYLRKSFTVSAADAAKTDALELVVEYNDGFAVWVNGVEVARRWAGPANQFLFHDHPAYDPDFNNANADTTRYSETVNLGAANTRLVAGTNVIAVQALNISVTSTNFLFSGQLRIGGASPVTLVPVSTAWKYFPGTVEPAGGLFDPALLTSGRLNVPWGRVGFDDTTWTSAVGPLGSGVSGLGTNIAGVVGVTPSVYQRVVFTASAAQAADTAALQLLVDYDDSFVAYLNGVEVARANLQTPNTFTPNTAVANGTRDWAGSQTTIAIDPANKVLVTGANVLAIQMHNASIGNTDFGVRADLRTGGGTTLVAANTTWKYLRGTTEPVPEASGAIEDNPDPPSSVADWIELHNDGAAPVSLLNWRLTDDVDNATGWNFPDVSIPAGGYLVVICDGEGIKTPGAGGFLHTDFRLNAEGEYLALRDNTGAIVQQFAPTFPPGHPHYSYGRNASAQQVYFDLATPGAANTGTQFSGIVAAPGFSLTGGYYSGTQNVALSTATSGASIRYTTDGTEPTETTGTAYSAAIPVSASTAVRARAFKAGMIPSATSTQTYLINESATRQSLTSVTLTSDQGRNFYRPFGVMAINGAVIGAGGNFTSEGTPWTALNDPQQYNNPNHRGRWGERPGALQIIAPGNPLRPNLEIGMRMAGSPFTRPRYTLGNQNSATPNNGAWDTGGGGLRKPSMNFYMRDDLGGDPLDFPLIPESPVTKHSDFRFRSGHNDSNPFVIDELMRRLYKDTGQLGSLGMNTNLYINGVWKGLFNLCQHLREEWCQEAFDSELDWDVIQVAVPSDGDLIAFQEMFTYLRNNPQSNYTAYQGMQARLEMVNFVDYLIVNIYGCTGDWPHNNWIMAHERSTSGRFSSFVWDAEGAFGGFNLTVVSNNFVQNPQNNGASGNQSSLFTAAPQTEGLGAAARILYTLLKDSPEFRLLFADRIQKHFFNNGALSTSRILARNTVLAGECSPFISGYNSTRIPNWVNGIGDTTRWTVTRNAASPFGITATTNAPGRRRVLLDGFFNDDTGTGGTPYLVAGFNPGYFVTEGLFPATLAPNFSQYGGNVAAGYSLTMTNPNAGGTIYYTLNGFDPRTPGSGAVQGTTYSGAVIINQPLTMKARVRSAGGEWSPLTEATFITNTTVPLMFSEIMYNPPQLGGVDGDEFEFIELHNTGPNTILLSGMQFTEGIDFTFPAGASIAPNGYVVVAKNSAQFAVKYPGVAVAGQYGPGTSLSDGGELVTLSDSAGNPIFSVLYDDVAPWPIGADEQGWSLVPLNPNAFTNPNNAGEWRLSTNLGGSPGVFDPLNVPPVYITEVLTHPGAGQVDAVELFNPNASAVDLSYWWLSDSQATPKKYQFPAGTSIAAGAYAVVTEAQFNPTPGVGLSFEFNKYGGDDVVFSSGDNAGNLTGHVHKFTAVPAAAQGVTYGRYFDSGNNERLVRMETNTLGAANGAVKAGPIVITEVMYNAPSGKYDFIELANISSAPVQLFDPADPLNPNRTWRVVGVEYAFPTGFTLAPRQVLILATTDPATFRTAYAVPNEVAVLQYALGGLVNNLGERVALEYPAEPGAPANTYIEVDSVFYRDTMPWPNGAGSPDGGGPSLERINWRAFADDVVNWRASAGTGNPGAMPTSTFAQWQAVYFTPAQQADPNYGGPNGDVDFDGLSNFWEFALGRNPLAADAVPPFTATLAIDNSAGPYLTVQYRRNLGASGLQYHVDTAAVPGTWTLDGSVPVGVPVNNGDGTETVTRRDTQATGTAAQRFIRLRVNN